MLNQPFAIPSLLLIVVSLPLLLGLIPRNRFYGFRTPQTLSSDDVWQRVNRLAAVALMIASGIYVGVATLWPYDRSAVDNLSTWALHLTAFVGPLVIGLGAVARYVKRLL
jgi:uncharacterized membrane protein